MDWSYVAGFFDGEGCITRNGKIGNCPAVTVGQAESNRIVIDELAKFLDDQGVRHRTYWHKTKSQPFFRIDVHAHAAVEKMLVAMLPYLVLKAPKARAALALIRGRTWARWTPRTEEQLRSAYALYLTGLSIRDVEERLGIHALRRAWKRLGFPRRTQREGANLWRSVHKREVAPVS